MAESLIRINPPINQPTQAALAGKSSIQTDQLSTQTAAYNGITAWHPVHYDCTGGSIVQPLPTSPTLGDEIELYLEAVSGTNTLTATFNSSTVATLKVVGHMTTVRYNGTTWIEGPDKNSLASQDNRYGFFVSAKDSQFGAKGNGTTDDTAALQAFITYVINNNLKGFIPAGTYKITSALNFTYKPNWQIEGAGPGATTIKQFTDNTPIFNLGSDTASLMHHWGIKGLNFDYNNNQSSANTNANPILMSQMPFEGWIRECNFAHGAYAIKVASGIGCPWGTSFDDLTFTSGLTLGAMDWSGGVNQTPNNHFGRLYVDCANMAGPVFLVIGYNFTIDEIEMINGNQSPQLFNLAAGGQLQIGAIKLEVGAYSASPNLIEASVNSYLEIGTISIAGNVLTLNNASPTILKADSGARIRVGYLTCSISGVTGSGTLYVANAGGDPGVEIDTVSIGSNCALVNNGSTSAPDHVKVKQWQNDRMSQDKGDANYTVALGDPNIIAFRTAFTAQRTITLPSDGNNLHNGLYYEIVPDGAINGSNTLVIQSSTTTLLTATEDKTVIRFTYSRLDASHGYNGWKITKYEQRADATTVQVGASSGGKVGFYGTTPISQQANTVDPRVALSNLGLIASGATSSTYGLGVASGLYALSNSPGAATTIALTLNQVEYVPIYLPAITITRIGVNVTTANTSATVRLGIYTNVGGQPASLVIDGGTIDASTTGYKEVTISQALSSEGWYWLAVCPQGATSSITASSNSGGNGPFIRSSSTSNFFGANPAMLSQASVSGALPSTPSSLAIDGNNIVRAIVKAA